MEGAMDINAAILRLPRTSTLLGHRTLSLINYEIVISRKVRLGQLPLLPT